MLILTWVIIPNRTLVPVLPSRDSTVEIYAHVYMIQVFACMLNKEVDLLIEYLVYVSIFATASLHTLPETLQRKLTRSKQPLLSEEQPFLVHIRSRLNWAKEAVLYLGIASQIMKCFTIIMFL